MRTERGTCKEEESIQGGRDLISSNIAGKEPVEAVYWGLVEGYRAGGNWPGYTSPL